MIAPLSHNRHADTITHPKMKHAPAKVEFTRVSETAFEGIRGRVESLLSLSDPDAVAKRLSTLLSVDVSEPFDTRKAHALVAALHAKVFANPSESVECKALLNAFIQYRWDTNTFIFQSDETIDVRCFDGKKPVRYEFMEDLIADNTMVSEEDPALRLTRSRETVPIGKKQKRRERMPVARGVVANLLKFPANAVEADMPHLHGGTEENGDANGGRIIFVKKGTATFNNGVKNGKRMQPITLPEGTIFFLPPGALHNFAAAKSGDGVTVRPLRSLVPTGPNGQPTAQDFINSGYEDDAFLSSIHVGWFHPDDEEGFVEVNEDEYNNRPWETDDERAKYMPVNSAI